MARKVLKNRKIDGKVYTYGYYSSKKTNVQEWKNIAKKQGALTRIIKDKYGYTVWVRNK